MVQDFGLRLLTRQDNLRRNDQHVDDLRMSLVASGQRTFPEVFPEYFPPRPVTTDDIPDEKYFGDEKEATAFDYSQAELDMAEASREIERLAYELSDDTVVVAGGEWV